MNISEGITTQLLWMLMENRKEKNSELSAFDIVDKLLSTPYSQSINQSISQSINRSINQSINQSDNESLYLNRSINQVR